MTVGNAAYQVRVPSELLVATHPEGEATVISLEGEADVGTLAMVREALARVIVEHQGPVVVDLTDTEFIDTATLRAVILTAERLGELGRRLRVRAPSRPARRMLMLSGFSGLVEEGDPSR